MPKPFKRFASLFFLNCAGVYNDNLMKHLIIYVGVGWQMPSYITRSAVITLVGAMMVVPYLLLSPAASALLLRYSKQKVLRVSKALELPIVAVAVAAFALQSIALSLIAVLLMGVQSCLYSPAKYALIPDVAREGELAFGSGLFEAAAFIGILIGTITAAVIADNYNIYVAAAFLFALAVIGYLLSRSLRIVEHPSQPMRIPLNPIAFIYRSFKATLKIERLPQSVYGASLLWFIGGMLQMNVVLHCTTTLQMTNTQSGIILALAAIGIAAGSGATGAVLRPKWSNCYIVSALIIIAVLLASIILFRPTRGLYAIVPAIAFAGAMLQTPCMTHIQSVSNTMSSGALMAYVNIVTFVFVLLGTALFGFVAYCTHENTYAIFGSMLCVALLSIPVFIVKGRRIRQE